MKILLLADEESKYLWDFFEKEKLDGIDLIISCGDLKAEYLLPAVIDECIHSGKGTVRVLETKDKWFGVTYKEDKPAVVASIQKLVDAGVYPKKLF